MFSVPSTAQQHPSIITSCLSADGCFSSSLPTSPFALCRIKFASHLKKPGRGGGRQQRERRGSSWLPVDFLASCSCKVPEWPMEDEGWLWKRLGKVPGIYRACGVVQVWQLSALSISNSKEPSGKQGGYFPYRRLQWNVQWMCCNAQGWISADRVGYTMGPPAKPTELYPLPFASLFQTQAWRWVRQRAWESATAGVLSQCWPWIHHSLTSHVTFVSISPSLSPGGWRQKHWERSDMTQLCFITF